MDLYKHKRIEILNNYKTEKILCQLAFIHGRFGIVYINMSQFTNAQNRFEKEIGFAKRIVDKDIRVDRVYYALLGQGFIFNINTLLIN